MPLEVTGDSARGDAFAFARLVVDGERIVEADAPGMARPLAGLTLLEAAAVPGETLAADAVANALAQVIRAAPSPGRVAVAMSGGVDSAVTLLRARPDAVGVTLRLWLDPAGPDSERACCSPDAVIRARETCHALGLPHVTLDLREAFRNTVVRSFVDGYASGVTPNPCMRCNGVFRFAALVGFAEEVGADVLWTGHYARIVERNGVRLVARAADPAKDQSYMLATVDPALLDPRRVPPRDDDEGGGQSGGHRGRPGGGDAAGEPGGVLPRGRRLPGLPCSPGARGRAGAGRRPERRGRRASRRAVAVHAWPASRDRRYVARAALRAPHGRRRERARRRPTAAARHDARRGSRSPVSRRRRRRGEASVPQPARECAGVRHGRRLLAGARRAGRGRRAGSGRSPVRR